MSDDAKTGIENLSQETRTFSPPTEFVQDAVARPSLYEEAERDRLAFWRSRASLLSWETPFTETLDWSNPPFARWFADGTLNVAYNCVDRHVESGHGSQVALLAEYEDGSDASFTYADVKDEISRMANVLADLGVRTGDRVAIYLPMAPRRFAMLARARSVHPIVFGGFSADRCAPASGCRGPGVVTTDGQNRRGKQPCQAAGRSARRRRASVEGLGAPTGGRRVTRPGRVVARGPEPPRTSTRLCGGGGAPVVHPLHLRHYRKARDHPHHRRIYLAGRAHPPQRLRPQSLRRLLRTADGWVTGHTYVVYGLMANRATQVMTRALDTPHQGRWWEIIEARGRCSTPRHRDRTAMKWGEDIPASSTCPRCACSAASVSVNPEAWMWYRRVIGGDRCPIVDTCGRPRPAAS